MTDLLEYLVRKMVDDPEAVEVTRRDEDSYVDLMIRVAPDDIGKVIGKSGRIIKALRTLMRAAGLREDKKVSVEILD
ncbi:MAG: KH domain-containing protein [Actinobacteria bacterium]|nr:MAG: KH domain-containing protein [Actinomycetota bacterium]